jgi:hypothetical protein
VAVARVSQDAPPPRTAPDEPAREAVLIALLADIVERLCVADAPAVVQSPPAEESAKAA